jgi:hypothetical protein
LAVRGLAAWVEVLRVAFSGAVIEKALLRLR